MKKLLFLLFMCLGLTFQVQAGVVEMTPETVPEAYKNHASDTSVCNVTSADNGSNGSLTGNVGIEGNAVKLYSQGGITFCSGDAFNNIAFCVANGEFASASFDGPYELSIPTANSNEMKCGNYPGGCSITIILAGDATFYTSSVVNSSCTHVTVKGSEAKGGGTVSWSGWNTPFIYTQNSPFQNLQITINSSFNNYQNQLPAFNLKNGWQVIADNNKFIVEQKSQNHLFYELTMNKITLNRNGQNFVSKTDLTNYLQNSDFFTKLGLNETQKVNSLNYILPQLPVANNYYLTILSDSAIQEISELNINPAPKQLNRIYYAIYPTTSPVKTNGDLVFPQIKQTDEFTILESGEILVKPEMFMFWE